MTRMYRLVSNGVDTRPWKGLRFPAIIFPDYEGVMVRCLPSGPVTASGAPIGNDTIRKQLSQRQLAGLEGYLVGHGRHAALKIINAPDGPGLGQDTVRFRASDDVRLSDRPYSERLASAVQRSTAAGLWSVLHAEAQSHIALTNIEPLFIAQGHNAVFLRNAQAPYVAGDSTIKDQALVRISRWISSEGYIVDIPAPGVATVKTGQEVVQASCLNHDKDLRVGQRVRVKLGPMTKYGVRPHAILHWSAP